jgi:hypothetical protein
MKNTVLLVAVSLSLLFTALAAAPSAAVVANCLNDATDACPSVVSVQDCYNGTSSDDIALHNAVGVAEGITAGFQDPLNARKKCGVPGKIAYIGAVVIPPKVNALGQVDNYRLENEIVITEPLRIEGTRGVPFAGGLAARIVPLSSPIMNFFHIRTKGSVRISDVELEGLPQTGGDGILVEGSAGGGDENEDTVIERVSLANTWNGIHLKAAAAAIISQCHIRESRHYGVFIQNTYNADHGDSTIEGTSISSAVENSIGIHQESGGGLRLVNNKIIGNYPATQGMGIGYELVLGSNVSTSILVITGNSIENQRDRGIRMYRSDSNSFFYMVTIGQNEIAGQNVGIEIFDAASPQSASWLRTVSIMGNVMMWQSNAAIALHQVEGAFLTGNVMHSAPTGIYLNTTGVTPTNVNISGNTYVAVTNHIVGSAVATLCPPSTCN